MVVPRGTGRLDGSPLPRRRMPRARTAEDAHVPASLEDGTESRAIIYLTYLLILASLMVGVTGRDTVRFLRPLAHYSPITMSSAKASNMYSDTASRNDVSALDSDISAPISFPDLAGALGLVIQGLALFYIAFKRGKGKR